MKLGMGMGLDDLIKWVGAGGEALSTLLNDLVSYWPLDEQSGTRYDAVGDNDLTDNNTVGAVNRGPVGTVASFVNTNIEYLKLNSLTLGTKYSLAFWAKEDLAVARVYINFYGGGVGNIYYYSANAGGFWVDGGSAGYVPGSDVMAGNVGWHHYVLAQGATQAEVWIDGVSVGTKTNAWAGGSAALWIGGDGFLNQCITGKMAGVALWSDAVSASVAQSLFANGNGKKYADLTTAEKVGLVSYWNLDEVSGQRNDSHGTNHLTDNNTVGSVNSGPAGTVANLVTANAEFLSNAAGMDIVFTGSKTYAGWAKMDSFAGNNALFHYGTSGALDFLAYVAATTGNLDTYVYDTTSGYSEPVVAGQIELGKWFFWEITYDASTKKLGARVNRGAQVLGGALSNGPKVSNTAFSIGAALSGNYASQGQLGSYGVWDGLVDLSSVFNSGAGKKYADLTTSEKVGLVSYWNLDEVSGTRVDSHGSNDLTDNNTVGSVINAGGAMDGAVASFVAANSEYLSRADNATLRQTATTTWAMWFKTSANGNYQCLIGKDSGSAPNREFNIYIDPAGKLYSEVYWDAVLATSTLSAIADGAWHHMVYWTDTDGKVRYSLDNAAVVVSAGTLTGTPAVGAAEFTIGKIAGYANNGLIDEVAIWSRVLTADERTELYNSGAGKFYPFA